MKSLSPRSAPPGLDYNLIVIDLVPIYPWPLAIVLVFVAEAVSRMPFGRPTNIARTGTDAPLARFTSTCLKIGFSRHPRIDRAKMNRAITTRSRALKIMFIAGYAIAIASLRFPDSDYVSDRETVRFIHVVNLK